MKIKEAKDEEENDYDFEEFYLFSVLSNYIDCVELYGDDVVNKIIEEIKLSRKVKQ